MMVGCLGYGSEMEASLPLLEILVLDLGLLFLVNKIVTCNVANLLLNHNGGMQNKKGRTVTFRVDESVAEKLELVWISFLSPDLVRIPPFFGR